MKNDNALAIQDEAPIQQTPMGLLQQAVQGGASIEQLTKLMELNERWQANEARMAYNAAMAEFKAHPPRIDKNKAVSFGNTKYSHATLDHVTDRLTEALSKVGISHRWSVKQEGPAISVSCVLTHSQGHSEATTLSATADTSGSKNAIQAIGSAVTYLQRYTLLAATGMAAADSDDDGKNSDLPANAMPEPEYLEWIDAINNCSTQEELKRVFENAYRAAKKLNDLISMQAFTKSKDKQKGQLK